jgi:catechol 2,3-dioxygenase-like lactoylglutathione lyase family enzyme
VGDNTAALLGLHHVQLAKPKGEEQAAVTFDGAIPGLATLRERIETAGHRVTDDVPLEGFRRCHVRDPFGNRLELVEDAEG